MCASRRVALSKGSFELLRGIEHHFNGFLLGSRQKLHSINELSLSQVRPRQP
jgi:hypothetical protein